MSFSCLYIVAQNRNTDRGTFFQHENHPHPPPLFERGNCGKESSLTFLLSLCKTHNFLGSTTFCGCKNSDGAAVVNLLPPTNVTTLNEFAFGIFIPYILKLPESCRGVNVVMDSYITSSIKESIRKKKREEMCTEKGQGSNQGAQQLADFFWDPTNKKELSSSFQTKSAPMTS